MSTTIPVLATDQVFPQADIVAGVLVLVMGFAFHFLGQLYSVLVPGQPRHRPVHDRRRQLSDRHP